MIKLVRLDYRLLHGQVCFTWVQQVGAQRVIVVDDATAASDLKKSALKLAKPQGVRLNIFSVATFIKKMPKVETLPENIMVIFGNTHELAEFCTTYPKAKEDFGSINYGAVANKDGAKQYDEAIFLTPAEQADTQRILDAGIPIYMQQTPMLSRTELTAL